MKLIYLAHPFGGQHENIDKVQALITKFLRESDKATFYSPLHATGFFYNEVDYLTGMKHCFEMLGRCDELWLTGDWKDSRGCNMEYAYAKGKGIPIRFING